MTHPTVNLGGTSREELLAQAQAVYNAAVTLRTALGMAGPHGRDYPGEFPGDTWPLFSAQEQHRRTCEQVDALVQDWRGRVHYLSL